MFAGSTRHPAFSRRLAGAGKDLLVPQLYLGSTDGTRQLVIAHAVVGPVYRHCAADPVQIQFGACNALAGGKKRLAINSTIDTTSIVMLAISGTGSVLERRVAGPIRLMMRKKLNMHEK